MAYDLQEQEQIASLKAWWKQYGNLVTWALIIALSAYSAWSGWKWYQRSQAAQASVLYDELQKAVMGQDSAKVQRVAKDMEDKFSGTTYAQMAGLLAARAAIDAGDAETAKAQLRWVADNGKDESYKSIARIRLAGVYLDEKDYDAALKLLSSDFPEQFAAMAEDRRGDILLAQNKTGEARGAYQKALEKMSQTDPARPVVQLKLDSLGGAVAAG